MTKPNLLTLTGHRPFSLGMLTCVVKSWKDAELFNEWIIIEDGKSVDIDFPWVRHLAAESRAPGVNTFLPNLIHGLAVAPQNESLLFIEDDDYYPPDYINHVFALGSRSGYDLIGFGQSHYYNLPERLYRTFKHKNHASLCQSAILTPLGLARARAIANHMHPNDYAFDVRLWADPFLKTAVANSSGGVVGIKGMPGRPGLGIGHRPKSGWTKDQNHDKLKELLGSDYDAYNF